jgi:hypothetical protein
MRKSKFSDEQIINLFNGVGAGQKAISEVRPYYSHDRGIFASYLTTSSIVTANTQLCRKLCRNLIQFPHLTADNSVLLSITSDCDTMIAMQATTAT